MFRDQRDVDRYYGRCPDCGSAWCGGRCSRPIPEPPIYGEEGGMPHEEPPELDENGEPYPF